MKGTYTELHPQQFQHWLFISYNNIVKKIMENTYIFKEGNWKEKNIRYNRLIKN